MVKESFHTNWANTFDPRAEIWHGGPHPPQKGQLVCLGWVPHPRGQGALKTGSWVHAAQTVHFWENFIKQKLKNAPDLVGAGQVRLDPRTYPGVWSMVSWQSGLKLCREMGTPDRSMRMFELSFPTPSHGARTALTMHFWEPFMKQKSVISRDILGQIWMLQWDRTLQKKLCSWLGLSSGLGICSGQGIWSGLRLFRGLGLWGRFELYKVIWNLQ